MSNLHIQLPQYHKAQEKIFLNNRFPVNIIVCGTKFGKTWGGLRKGIFACLTKPGQLVWWVAPTYDYCKIAIEETFDKLWPPDPDFRDDIEITKKDPREIRFKHWLKQHQPISKISFRSAQFPKSLKGRATNLILGDEAAMWSEDAFDNLVTTTTQTGGQMFIFTTPRGKGTWLYYQWLRGWDGDEDYDRYDDRDKFPIYKSWRAPTLSNPFVKRERVADLAQTLAPRIFEQEYWAHWIDDGGDVFRFTDEICCLHKGKKPEKTHTYVVAWDPARRKSNSAWSVFDISVWPFEERDLGIFPHDTPWPEQWLRIARISRRWMNARVIYDDTGNTRGVHKDGLKKNGVRRVMMYDFGKQNGKYDLVNMFIAACDQKEIKLLRDREAKDEMDSYGYKISDTLHVKYGPPKGATDDRLDARMMAFWLGMKINPKGTRLKKKAERSLTPTLQEIRRERMLQMKKNVMVQNEDFISTQLLYQGVDNPNEFLKDPYTYINRRREMERNQLRR